MSIRELRAKAREALKGNLMKVTLPIFLSSIFVYVSSIFLYLQGQLLASKLLFNTFWSESAVAQSNFGEEALLIIVEFLLIFSIFVLPIFLNFIIAINTIKISRNEKSNFCKEIFSMRNIKSFFGVWWGLFKKYVIWIVLMILSVIGITSYSGKVSYVYEYLPIITLGVAAVMTIITTYRYMLVYYLKYDYPDKPTKDLFKKSKMMMYGNKAKAIVIPLTLFGWYLLNYFVSWGIIELIEVIWLAKSPLLVTLLADAIVFFLSSILTAYIYMINYQFYMEQKPLELYNDDYLKPETNAKKYIWILITAFICYILLIVGIAFVMYMTTMRNIL